MFAGAAVGVVAVIGLGGWGAFALLAGGGSQPAEAIPANAIGYVSLDLDPSAGQKIEAIQILEKFPGIDEELDISDRDDLRRYVFDKAQEADECKGLDYDDDIGPWIGDRIGVAGVPKGEKAVAPLVALQVTDQEAASAGVKALAACASAEPEDYGYSFSGDYLLITESTKQAETYADQVEKGSLADDDTFQARMDDAGDAGIITMYASPEAPDFLVQLQQSMGGSDFASQTMVEPAPASTGALDSDMAMESTGVAASGEMEEGIQKLFEDFEGMAGVVRIADGGFELEFATSGMSSNMLTGLPGGGEAGTAIEDLPASTGAAFSLALPDNWLSNYIDQISALMGQGADAEGFLSQLEAETGLSLPEDIETVLGDSVAVAIDAEIDVKALEQGEPDPSDLLAGLKVEGDPDEILPVVDKIKASIGPEAEQLLVEEGDDAVAFGLNQEYVDGLLSDGTLGDEESFQNVVPEADEASSVFYVNFDAGDGWAVEFADAVSGGSSEVRENVEPLDAFAVSGWVEDDVAHSLVRLTTD